MSLTIATAYVCVDCEAIGPSSRCCSMCGSLQLWPLARFLNRTDPCGGSAIEAVVSIGNQHSTEEEGVAA